MTTIGNTTQSASHISTAEVIVEPIVYVVDDAVCFDRLACRLGYLSPLRNYCNLN
jgi:hypothetical protein